MSEIEKFTSIVNEKLDLLEDKIRSYLLDISSSSDERIIKKEELDYFVDKYIDIKIR